MTLKEKLATLPLRAVEIGFPENGDFIDEIVGDCVVRFTHQYQPDYGGCYVAEIKGTELGYREALNLISETIGISPCELKNKRPRKVVWLSGSSEIPEGCIIRQLGREKVDEICEMNSLNHTQKLIVEQMLALSSWFILEDNHGSEKKYLQRLMEGLDIVDQNNIYLTLFIINMEFAHSVQAMPTKPG